MSKKTNNERPGRPQAASKSDEDLAFEAFEHAGTEPEEEGEDPSYRYEEEFFDFSEEEELRDGQQEIVEVPDERALPLIAIVGRPNVGKSRLFNRMTGTRFAIVEDMPGVTRDRQYGEGRWDNRGFQVVDTGGFEPDSPDELLRQMREQAELAIHEADIVFFVMDARAGITPADRDIAQMLRAVNRPLYVIANKIDAESQHGNVAEFYELGFSDVFAVSAEHGYGFTDLMDEVSEHLPEWTPRPENDERIHIAVVGRPNAGKSTLINRLLGEDRLLTSDIPGTTRDSVNTLLRQGDREYLIIDTAGIRRKKRIHETVEKYSVVQAFKALDRADVAIIMLDATQPVASQDQRIAGLARDKGCAIIFVLNKWDLIEKDHRTADEYIQRLRDAFLFATWAPVVTVSAKTGQRVHKMLGLVNDVFDEYSRRISTADANRFLESALRRRSPPQKGNRRLKFYYASQVAQRPPTFMFSVNNPTMVHFSYERFLMNGLRETFGFRGTPIKIFYRGKGQT